MVPLDVGAPWRWAGEKLTLGRCRRLRRDEAEVSIAVRLGRAGVVVVVGAALMLFVAPWAGLWGWADRCRLRGATTRRPSGSTSPSPATSSRMRWLRVRRFRLTRLSPACLRDAREHGQLFQCGRGGQCRAQGIRRDRFDRALGRGVRCADQRRQRLSEQERGTFPQGATAAQVFESHRASRGQDHLTFVASLSESPDWFVGARNIELRPGGVWD